MRLSFLLALLGATLACASGCGYRGHLQAASVLARITAEEGTPTPDWFLGPVRELDLSLELEDGPLRARLYLPALADVEPEGGVLLLHGVHPLGIDQPRFVAFARALAAAGLAVLTPTLPELLDYRVEAGTVERIGALARQHARLSGRRRVGVLGISFAGGLSLMAAAREDAGRAIGYVVAVGAHQDLRRLGRYYAGAEVRGPGGERPYTRAHPYGLRIIVRAHANHFFEGEDVGLAREALRLFLDGEPDAARQLSREMSEVGRARMDDLLHRHRYRKLERPLLAAIERNHEQLAAASPRGQLAGLRVPVYLVHGLDDPVIPSIETRWLARQLEGRVPLHALVTPMLRHTDLSAPTTERDRSELIHTMASILQRARETR